MEKSPGVETVVMEESWWLLHCGRELRQLVWGQVFSSVELVDPLPLDDASSSQGHHLAQLGCEHSRDSLELTSCRRTKQELDEWLKTTRQIALGWRCETNVTLCLSCVATRTDRFRKE